MVLRRGGDPPPAYRADEDGLDLLLLGAHVPPKPPFDGAVAVTALVDVELETLDKGLFVTEERDLGRALGSTLCGVRHEVMPPGAWSCPPHWHAQEHELFHVLEGDGELLLFDGDGAQREAIPMRAGHLVSRPAATGVAHALRAGGRGLTYLAFGTREPGEVVFYPRSRKAYLGPLLVRVEPARTTGTGSSDGRADRPAGCWPRTSSSSPGRAARARRRSPRRSGSWPPGAGCARSWPRSPPATTSRARWARDDDHDDTEGRLGDGLHHISIDPQSALEEYLLERLPARPLADLLSRSRLFGYFAAATPGMRELLTVGKVWELAQDARRTPGGRPYDLVVLDAPATGHGVAILEAPRTFAEIARVGPIHRQGRTIDAMLSDPARTGVVVVARPEEMPVNEALALERALAARVGLPVSLVVANALLPDRFSGRRRGGARGPPTAIRAAAARPQRRGAGARPARPARAPAARARPPPSCRLPSSAPAPSGAASWTAWPTAGADAVSAGVGERLEGKRIVDLRGLGRRGQDDDVGRAGHGPGGAGPPGGRRDDRPRAAAGQLARARRARQRAARSSTPPASPATASRCGASCGP